MGRAGAGGEFRVQLRRVRTNLTCAKFRVLVGRLDRNNIGLLLVSFEGVFVF